MAKVEGFCEVVKNTPAMGMGAKVGRPLKGRSWKPVRALKGRFCFTESLA